MITQTPICKAVSTGELPDIANVSDNLMSKLPKRTALILKKSDLYQCKRFLESVF